MKDRRIGFIDVHDRLLRDAIDSGHGANMFNGAVPLEISRDFIIDRVRITMWHPDFDQIEEGRCLPEYIGVFHDGCVYPSFRRVAK